MRGWRVVDRYIDDDISAYTGRARTEYQRMLGDLRDGVIEGVVVWHLDRLHRRPKELEEFLQLCDAHGVTALASVSGDIDLGTHDGQLMARVLGAFARKESDDKSRRIRRKRKERELIEYEGALPRDPQRAGAGQGDGRPRRLARRAPVAAAN